VRISEFQAFSSVSPSTPRTTVPEDDRDDDSNTGAHGGSGLPATGSGPLLPTVAIALTAATAVVLHRRRAASRP
jgi:LPXTG-motif cell wall-anchored protein